MQALSINQAPEVLRFEISVGPPLPASTIIFTVPKGEVYRIMYCNVKVTKPTAGALLQSTTLHDENGNILWTASLTPLLNAASVFGPLTVLNLAGPEQVRVPFFIANTLSATWPKDCYAKENYFVQFNNLGGAGNETAIVDLFVASENA